MDLLLLVFKLSENLRASVLGIFVYSLLTGAGEQLTIFLEHLPRPRPVCVGSVLSWRKSHIFQICKIRGVVYQNV